MPPKQRVLVAGATGYLGKIVVKALSKQGYWVRALSRNHHKIDPVKPYVDDVFIAEVTRPETLRGICKDIDIVFSSLGITRQKDGLTYNDVDYQGNKNLLDESLAENVSKFMYISALNADKLRHVKILMAKEQFVDELKTADIEHIIIRPNGFFSDMAEFINMAKKGCVYLLGNGERRVNPIHGEDLAEACLAHFKKSGGEFDIGGPEVLTHNEIAFLAFEALKKPPKITHLPLWIKNWVINPAKVFTSVKTYGPIEFFLTVMSMDMIAPTFGRYTIKKYFSEISNAGPPMNN
jgi:uncharacterized protein YbjT (DUF2867 family)